MGSTRILCTPALTIRRGRPSLDACKRCRRAMQQTAMPIAAVSSLLGIPVPTIRSWERRYGFPVPPRTKGKHRRYSIDEVEQLRLMRDEITRGHSASEAVDIVRRSSNQERPRSALLDGFLEAAMRLDPTKIREILTEGTESLGVEETMRDVALPAMREMGSRWKAGVCDTAHEHLATEAVRVWLARQSVMAPRALPPRAARARLRPEGPAHDRPRGVRRRAGRRGWSLRTLGRSRPSRRSSRRCARRRPAVRWSPASEA